MPSSYSAPSTTLANASENRAVHDPNFPNVSYFRVSRPKSKCHRDSIDTKPTKIPYQAAMDPRSRRTHTLNSLSSSRQTLAWEKKKPTSPCGPQPSSLLVPQRPCQPGDLVRHYTMPGRSKPQQCKGARRVCARRSRRRGVCRLIVRARA